MKNEIKPGVLCYLRGIEDPAENNGRVVEVLSLDRYYPELGENVWWILPNGPILAYQEVEVFGRTYTFKKNHTGKVLAKQSTLVPINDPDLEVDDATTKDIAEVL